MRRDPLTRLPGRVRLLGAAVLCLTPMGLAWSSVGGHVDAGTIYDNDCGWVDGAYVCDDTTYEHGWYHPGVHLLVSQSPIRVFLVVAALALTVAALRARSAVTVALARIGVIALLLAAIDTAAHGVTRPLFAVFAALALAAPLVTSPAGQRRPVDNLLS